MEDIPSLPRDLTDVEDAELMILFGQFTAWSNYASTKRSEAEIEEAEMADELAFADASATILGWDAETGKESSRRVTITKARKLADEKVQEAIAKRRVAHSHRKLVVNMAEMFERNTALISRELSRRIGTSPVDRRHSRWGGG